MSGGVHSPTRISTHTYAALVTTVALLAGGTLLYAALEWHGVLAPLGLVDKIVNVWFMATTPRTAGFIKISLSAPLETLSPWAQLTLPL